MDKLKKDIIEKLKDLEEKIEFANIKDYVSFSDNPYKRLWANFLNGIARGVGSAIGVSMVFTLLVIILKWIAGINIPIISDIVFWIISLVET